SAKMFEVLHATRDAQAAVMILRPGQHTGEVQNEHPAAEQWLYVISGHGRATVGRRTAQLREGMLLLIPKALRIKSKTRREGAWSRSTSTHRPHTPQVAKFDRR